MNANLSLKKSVLLISLLLSISILTASCSESKPVAEINQDINFKEVLSEETNGNHAVEYLKMIESEKIPHAFIYAPNAAMSAKPSYIGNYEGLVIFTDYKSLQKSNKYINQNGNPYSINHISRLSKYDEEYFKEKAVILFIRDFSCGLIISHFVKSLKNENNTLKINIEYTTINTNNADTALYSSFSILEVDKSDVINIKDIQLI